MGKWRPTELNCLYVIADVHGKYDQLQLIFNRILPLRKSDGGQDKLVMLGDYIDRGKQSDKVIDLLIEKKKEFGDNLILLRGNHELMFHKAMFDQYSDMYRTWMATGGEQTLLSYMNRVGRGKVGIAIDNPYVFDRKRIKDIIPREHIDFLENTLENYYCEGDYIFVHAGWYPEHEPQDQTDDNMFWGNDSKLPYSIWAQARKLAYAQEPAPWDKTIVIGHFWKGPFITDKLMMLDCSNAGEVLVAEMHSREAFVARPKKERLVKISLKNYMPKKKSPFRRVE